jgi:hypothetical protein
MTKLLVGPIRNKKAGAKERSRLFIGYNNFLRSGSAGENQAREFQAREVQARKYQAREF